MAIKRERDPKRDALIQRAAAELRASNPELFEEPKPYTDEEYAQVLADAAEIERMWDEMDNSPPDGSGVSAADLIGEDIGE